MSHPTRPKAQPAGASTPQLALHTRFAKVRAASLALVAPLSEADCQVQSMPDASPAKWHLAHTTWFFETFVLERFEPQFKPHHPAFKVLFNSYYHGVGEQHPRPQRGLITRPGLADILGYRHAVDERVQALLSRLAANLGPGEQAQYQEVSQLLELGLQHEQQHQELMLTDLKHLLSCNPLAPAYVKPWPLASIAPVPLSYLPFEGGPAHMGHQGVGFSFDNETPRHRVWLEPYALANRLVTYGEWAEFVADGGYSEPRWWLSAGWEWVRAQRVQAPLYWRRDGAASNAAPNAATAVQPTPAAATEWQIFTLHGLVPLSPHTPVCHISLYEADAYARWRGAQEGRALRLPTEAEWEHAAAQSLFRQTHLGATAAHTADNQTIAAKPKRGLEGNFVESGAFHPMPLAQAREGLLQLWGDVWEWTSSSYQAYPGYKPWEGAVGEYNGKFMINQYVLRGGSCATPLEHMRASYRNFFPADMRWQFCGLRLACDEA
jgi:ergothioneine biosynthesis protein EgtB